MGGINVVDDRAPRARCRFRLGSVQDRTAERELACREVGAALRGRPHLSTEETGWPYVCNLHRSDLL
jgi:hypothetical protein